MFVLPSGALRVASPAGPQEVGGDRPADSLARAIEAAREQCAIKYIAFGGETVLLSARTDTGKTSTILNLLRRHQGVFFSDDMLILGEDGWLSRYPKPLTISAHTVRSTPQNRLGLRSRLTLPVQSRLHSREGRAAGKRLGEMSLPIMGLNALVQALCRSPAQAPPRTCDNGDAPRKISLFHQENLFHRA